MSGFKLRKDPLDGDVEQWTISSGTAYVPGDLFDLAAGAATATITTSSSICYNRKGVLMEAVSTTDTLIKVRIVTPDQIWEVESAANSAAASNGDAFALTDHNTVNNAAHSVLKEAVVVQVGVVGAVGDKRILVKFTSTVSGLTHAAA